jgi:hypothetical protein
MPTEVPTYDDHVALLALVQANRDLLESVLRSLDDIESRLNALEPIPNTPPTVTLLGDNPVIMVAGDDYHEQGATAYDTEDGELPVSIVATDLSRSGEYELTYTATDSGGLSATATRTVIVNAPLPPSPGTDVAAKLARPLVTADSFELLGGIVLNSKFGNGVGYKEEGSIYVEHLDGNRRVVTMSGHPHRAWEGHQFTFSLSQFGNPNDLTKWPVVSNSGSFPKVADDKTKVDTGFGFNGQVICGVTRPNGGLWLSSGYAGYAAAPQTQLGPFLSWFDQSGPVGILDTAGTAADIRPRFGGGFCDIPKWFADEFLDGRDFGLAKGGYHSGGGSSHGPALCVMDRPADGATKATRPRSLIWYPWEGVIHANPWPERGAPDPLKTLRVKRFPDYTGTAGYMPRPDGDIGYWGWEMSSSGCWVDTDTQQGLVYLSSQSTGDFRYQDQGNHTYALRMYVYDPNEIVRVAKGQLDPWKIEPTFHVFDRPGYGHNGNIGRDFPAGTYFDSVDKLYYVFWKGVSGTAPRFSALTVYEVK